jgi:hypothetical protein
LEGAKKSLAHTDFIYIEFSKIPLYNGGTTIDKLDEFLYDDFVNMEQVYAHALWGDCLYIRRDLVEGST